MRVNESPQNHDIRPLHGKILTVYKNDDTRSSVWLESDPNESYVVKRFENLPIKQWFLAILQIHPGQCERRAHTRLRNLGLPVIAIEQTGWQKGRYYLTTQPIGPSLSNALSRGLYDQPTDRHHLAVQLGQLTGQLLKHRLFFRDLKSSNILLTAQNTLLLIDAGSVRKVWQHALPQCAKRMFDLLDNTVRQAACKSPAILILSRTDRLRYLLALLGQLQPATASSLCQFLKLKRLLRRLDPQKSTL
jgi:serine/threonine protein kinase